MPHRWFFHLNKLGKAVVPLSKHLGPAITGPATVAVPNWDGTGIRPSFGANKQLYVEQTDESLVQSEDSLAGMVARDKVAQTNRGVEAENRLGTPGSSYYKSQSEYLF